MKNDKEKLKKPFKTKIYRFVLRIVRFVEKLPKETTSQLDTNSGLYPLIFHF